MDMNPGPQKPYEAWEAEIAELKLRHADQIKNKQDFIEEQVKKISVLDATVQRINEKYRKASHDNELLEAKIETLKEVIDRLLEKISE